MDINEFDVTKCLPYDIMHTIFEGVAIRHLQCLLPYLIETKKYFTLEQLNTWVQSHKYGYSEVDTRPVAIQVERTPGHGFKIHQSGL